MGYPKVSVVVVTFNHEDFIKEALLCTKSGKNFNLGVYLVLISLDTNLENKFELLLSSSATFSSFPPIELTKTLACFKSLDGLTSVIVTMTFLRCLM